MAVLTAAEIRKLDAGKLRGQWALLGSRLQYLGTDGVYTGTLSATDLDGTTKSTFTVDDDAVLGQIAITVAAGAADKTMTWTNAALTDDRTITFPDVTGTVAILTATQTMTNKTLTSPVLTTPTIASFANANHDHSNSAGGGALAGTALALQGTTYNSFTVDSDNTTGTIKLQVTTGGTANTVTLTNTATTADRTITLPDLTGTVALVGITGQKNYLELDGSTSGGIKIAPTATGTGVATIVNQNVATSTITLPSATCTLPGLALANTWAAAQTFTTGGIIASAIVGQDSSLGITGMTGSSSAGGDVVVAGGIGNGAGNAGGVITLTTGAGIAHTSGTGGASGALTVTTGAPGGATTGTGGASGALTLSTGTGSEATGAAGIGGAGGALNITGGTGGAASDSASGNGGAGATITITAGTGGASTFATQGAGGAIVLDAGAGGTAGAITIGGTNAESVGIGRVTKVTTIAGTATVAEETSATNAVVDVLSLAFTSSGTVANNLGLGISLRVEDGGGAREQASVDVVLTDATNGQVDADMVFSTSQNDTVTEAMRLDASDQSLTIGVNNTDADNLYRLRLYPVTASRGSLILSATAHASADYATTITNATDGSAAATITLPNATCTLPGIGLANTFTAVQSLTLDDTTNGVVNPLVLTHSSSDNNATALDGVGISFQLENATGTSTVEEWGSLDVVSTTITNGSEDADAVLSLMLNGTVTEAVRLDGSDQSLSIGTNATDADGFHQLRIFPVTADNGSLIISATATGAARTMTITNATLGQSTTLTIPDPGGSTASFVLTEGTQTINGAKTFGGAVGLAANQNLTFAQGTGYAIINAETSGSLKILPAAITTSAVVLTTPSCAAGTTITLPNATCTLPGIGLNNAWTGTNDFQGNVTASTGNPTFVLSGSSGVFTTSSGTNTLSGDVVIANGKTLKIGSGTGGVASALQIYSPTATNGSIIISCTNNTAARDLTITNAALGQTTTLTIIDPGNSAANFMLSKGTNTCTGTYDLSGGSVTLPAGSVTRAQHAEEALAVYRIPLTNITDGTGLHLVATPTAGLFGITSGGYGVGTLLLSSEGANNNTKTSTAMFEFALPPEYVAAGDVKVVFKAKYAGAGTVGTKTLDCQAYELDDDGAVGGDICATTIATLTDSYAAHTFNITATDLVAGDKIIVFFQAIIQETATGGALTVTVGNVEVQADIKG